MQRAAKSTRKVSRRVWLAPLVALPIGAVLLLARGEGAHELSRDKGALGATLAGTSGHSKAENRIAAVPAAAIFRRAATPTADRALAGAAAKEAPAASPSSSDLLSALGRCDADGAREIYLQLSHSPLQDEALVAGLLALAADPRTSAPSRQVALDLVATAPGADETTLAKVAAIALSADLDADTRTRAIDVLHQLANGREELATPARAALLAAAEHAPNAEARALALDAVVTAAASDSDVARVTVYLGDANAQVRASAARSLETSHVRVRASVAAALERSILAESDPEAAATMICSALRIGRGDADAILVRLERAPIVRSSTSLARQITDYRRVLASGETDPQRVESDHQTREEALLRANGN